MRTALSQLRLVVWKNYLVRRRQKVRLAIEIVWPLLLFLLLVWVRTRGLRDAIPECYVHPKVLPSTGALPFLQNWFCTLNNTCSQTFEEADTPLPLISLELLRKMSQEISSALANSNAATRADNQSTNLRSLLPAVLESSQLADISHKVNSSNYKPELVPLHSMLKNLEDVWETMRPLNFSDNELHALLDSLLSNSTYNYAPFTLLLDNPSQLVCANISKGLSSTDLLVNQKLCSLLPNETDHLRKVLESHWNESFDKNLVKEFIKRDLQEEIAFNDLKMASKLYNNLTRTSEALPKAQEALSPEGSAIDSIMRLASNRDVVERIVEIVSRTLCANKMASSTSFIDNSKTRLEEIKEQYQLKDKPVYVYDESTTPFCNNVFENIETNPMMKVIWRTYKHLLLGQILYTPMTPTVERIMKRLNETYFQFHKYRKLLENPAVEALLSPGRYFEKVANDLKAAQDFLKSPAGMLIMDNNSKSNFNDSVVSNLNVGEEALKSAIKRAPKYPWSAILDCLELDRVRPIKSIEEAEETAKKLQKFNRIWALVEFPSEMDKIDMTNQTRADEEGTVSPARNRLKREIIKESSVKNVSSNSNLMNPNVIYKIRMDADFVDSTGYVKDSFARPSGRFRPTYDLKYITYGFAYLQDMIERSIIVEQTGAKIDDLPRTILQQYPYPCYIDDQFIKAISRTFPLLMVLAWIFTCSMIVKSIVYEKELRLKQTMQVMGLRNCVFWIGWFIDSLFPMLIAVIMLTFTLTYGKVLLFSDPTVIFVFLLLYCLSTIFASFLISVFFSRANIAAACAGIIFFIFYLPYPFMATWILHFSDHQKFLVCLSSNVALGVGASYIAGFEEQGVGIQWDNIASSPLYADNFSMRWVMVMMVVDSLIYLILTWYIEAVLPGQYGIPLPWYFPVSVSYWCGSKRAQKKLANQPRSSFGSNNSFKTTSNSSELPASEPEPKKMYAGVQIKNLTKVYSNGKVAVDNLSMNFYEDQITSFLGHNGAGKTTTISILTGLYPPTSGTAIICGYDIRTDIEMIRKNLGMCPQYNVLFNRLTVLEHLEFYGLLRGTDKAKVTAEFEQMLVDLNLPDKRNAFPDDLSGGMQRKLSVALAFIGGSRVVILDEPTSGVDPYSRRAIWELLLKYKKGRTVILTTHYMDEADLLGDRIGIISKGTVKSSGSSFFLKNKYGSGYTLTVELKPEPAAGQPSLMPDSQKSLTKGYDKLPITVGVRRFVPKATVTAKFGNEIVFSLPTKDSHVLERLCSFLDDELFTLNALSYGVSDTSLEEVFLSLTDDDLPEEQRVKSNTQVPIDPVSVENEPKKPGNKYIRQFVALHVKRFHHTKRNAKAIFSELILPPLLVLISLLVLMTTPERSNRPAMVINGLLYNEYLHYFTKDVGQPSSFQNDVRESFFDEHGLGVPCPFNPLDFETRICLNVTESLDNPNYKLPDCSCSSGSQLCESPIDEPPPSFRRVVSGDYVHNMTDFKVHKWIVYTKPKYSYTNIGGFEFGVNFTLTDTRLIELLLPSGAGTALISPNFNRDSTNNIRLWFNNKAWISSVLQINNINNNILRVLVKKNGTRSEPLGRFRIIVINHPLKFTEKQLDLELTIQSAVSLLQAICIIFAVSFITASFLLYLIEERISNSKHLQLVSGVNRFTYWLQAFTWDLTAFSISATLCILVFVCFQTPEFISRESFIPFVLLFFLYGWSCIPMMYPASFFFDVPSSAFVAMSCGNMFIGIITTISTSVLSAFPDDDLKEISKVLSKVFLIFPHYCLGNGMITLSVRYYSAVSLAKLDILSDVDPFEWDFIGKNLFCMFFLGIVFFLVTLCIEFRVIPNILHLFRKEHDKAELPVGDEDDVALERKRVYENPNDLLVIKDLTKKYQRKPTPSVNRICIGVKKGECFGLLGLNGAGKTTTFKMLTGAIKPTSGDATIGGHSVRDKINDVRALLGYCPQFDALDALLTTHEHLVFYARVRNIPSNVLKSRVERYINRLGLRQYRNKLAGDLSGGNKRKLSTAIALLGNPPLVFLDEPTTGMDPKARRFLWNCISDVVKEGGCVILTSHSMEECQALCTRLTIMVNGQCTCLGSCQRLKNKYGKGYLLIIRCAENSKEKVKAFLGKNFKTAKITEEHFTQLRYEVPISRLSEILSVMENAKHQGIVVDYSVTQTTLEEVFIRFAREQADPEDRKPKTNLFSCCDCKGHKGSSQVSSKHQS